MTAAFGIVFVILVCCGGYFAFRHNLLFMNIVLAVESARPAWTPIAAAVGLSQTPAPHGTIEYFRGDGYIDGAQPLSGSRLFVIFDDETVIVAGVLTSRVRTIVFRRGTSSLRLYSTARGWCLTDASHRFEVYSRRPVMTECVASLRRRGYWIAEPEQR